MKQSNNGSAQARAGARFMERLKAEAPQTYKLFSQKLAADGMGSVSDFWTSLGNAVTTVVQQAPAYYVNKEQAKRELDAAQKAAEMELKAAQLELQAQQQQAAYALEQARMQQNQIMINEQIRRQQELAAQQSELSTILGNLTGGQKGGLLLAGGLGLLLVYMMSNRK